MSSHCWSRELYLSKSIPMQIISDFDLSSFNTLAIPAKCAHYCEVETEDELRCAIIWADTHKLPVYILGGGSNVLLAPYINALVIRNLLKGIYIDVSQNAVADDIYITAAAGELWHEFVMSSIGKNWFGLENLALIPGSVGAAPIQNIGAYGVELKDRFHKLTALNMLSGVIEEFFAADCQFGYRESIFKKNKKNHVILDVTFRLSLINNPVIHYPALQIEINRLRELASLPDDLANSDITTAQMVAKAVISLRTSKLPDPSVLPNAGSFFKNPLISKDKYFDLRREYPDLVAYDDDSGYMKLAAAWLIDRLGWKGKSYRGASVHHAQALVLTNPNRCELACVLALADKIRRDVKDRFGVDLEIEPQLLER